MADDEKNRNKVTAGSYGNVNTDDVSKECWMLRVPPKLADAWDKLPEGSVLGELVFRKGGKQNGDIIRPSFDIHVAPPVAESNDTLPLQYSLQAMTKKLPTLHPFTRHSNGSVQVHGTITRTANLQVHQDSNYRQLCKKRILESTVHNSRYVKPVESNQVVQNAKRRNHMAGFGDAVHHYGKRLLEAANAPTPTKKAKFTQDQPTKSVIFQLFSQQVFWTVKDLKVASGGRPETEIRDVLREIGDYHRSGDHKNTWELRKEFQAKTS
jgi:hypothetical protein